MSIVQKSNTSSSLMSGVPELLNMMFLKFTFLAVFIFSNSSIFSQDLFLWNAVTENGIQNRSSIPSHYEMNTLNIMTGEIEQIFRLDKEEFIHDNMSGEAFFITSFDFTIDRDTFYFLEDEGDIYRYLVSNSEVTFLTDITPLNTDFIYNSRHVACQIDFINSTELFVSGFIEGVFNTKTNLFTSLSDCVEPCNSNNNSCSTIRYKDAFISETIYREIIQYQKEDPYDYDVIFSFDEYIYCDLFVEKGDCETNKLFVLEYYSNSTPQKDSILISHVDLENGSLGEPLFFEGFNNDNSPFKNEILDIQHRNTIEWEDCQLVIDLDAADNTMEGVDILIDSLCSHQLFPVPDLNVKIRNDFPIDSITIQAANNWASLIIAIETNILTQYGLSTIPFDNSFHIFKTEANVTNQDFENVLNNLVLGAFDGQSEVILTFNVWYNGQMGEPATATLLFATPFPQSGDDVSRVFCEGDPNLNLNNIIPSNADDGGLFYSLQFEEIDLIPEYEAPISDSLYYITTNGICYDTAQIINVVNPNPAVESISDFIICYDELIAIDLTNYSEDVEWEDGSFTPLRTIGESGTYIYELRNEYGCTTNDTFMIQILETAESLPIEARVCKGESFSFMGIDYNMVGNLSDTLMNINGCDSIIYNIGLDNFENIPLELSGDLWLCEDESGLLDVESNHTNFSLNGVEFSGNEIDIDQAGTYNLIGYDENGCFYEREVIVHQYASPIIFVEDLIDTVFGANIEVPIDYQGDIVSYNWTPSFGLNCDDCPFPFFTENENGTYMIEVTDQNGCIANASVTLRFRSSDIYLPNVIAMDPNVPENGRLFLSGTATFMYSLQVFDRWGNLIFDEDNLQMNDYLQGWKPESKYKNGVFVFKIKYVEGKDEKVLIGDITVK